MVIQTSPAHLTNGIAATTTRVETNKLTHFYKLPIAYPFSGGVYMCTQWKKGRIHNNNVAARLCSRVCTGVCGGVALGAGG